MYLTTTTTPQWQHADGSTRQATGTDNHCLGTCPSAAQVSLYPPQRRTRVAGWTTVPLPHEPPHQNWTACPSESSSAKTCNSHTGWHRGCKRGWSRTHQPKRRKVSRVAWGSMWACVTVEHKHTPGQFSSYPGSTIGIVAASFTWTTFIHIPCSNYVLFAAMNPWLTCWRFIYFRHNALMKSVIIRLPYTISGP
jgi:hypothetical protein